jgi:hypothetical protein
MANESPNSKKAVPGTDPAQIGTSALPSDVLSPTTPQKGTTLLNDSLFMKLDSLQTGTSVLPPDALGSDIKPPNIALGESTLSSGIPPQRGTSVLMGDAMKAMPQIPPPIIPKMVDGDPFEA